MQISLENKYIGIIVGCILAFYTFIITNAAPDIDQSIRIPFIIQHRSMLTHNALLCAVIGFISLPVLGRTAGFLATLGASVGTILHLGSDMFPAKWHGYAFIHIPIIGKLAWIKPVAVIFSWSWLAINCLAAICVLAIYLDDE